MSWSSCHKHQTAFACYLPVNKHMETVNARGKVTVFNREVYFQVMDALSVGRDVNFFDQFSKIIIDPDART